MLDQSSSPNQSAPTPEREANVPRSLAVAGGSLVLGFILALLALGAFALLAFSFGHGVFERLDDTALRGAYSLRVNQSWLTPLMRTATVVGDVWGIAVQALLVCGFLLWRKPLHWRSNLVLLLLVLIGAAVLFVTLKSQFARPRPQLYPSPYPLTSYSFPSGHSTAAAAFYGGLAVIAARSMRGRGRRIAVALLAAVITVTIGLSRMYFSVHYPTDILGGFSAGVGWLVAVQTIWQGIIWRRSHNGTA